MAILNPITNSNYCAVSHDLNRYLAEQHAQASYDEAFGTRAYQIEKEILADDSELASIFNEDLTDGLNSVQAAHAIRELLKGNAAPMAAIFQGALDTAVNRATQDELGVH